jgi:CRISPR-associated protein Cas1
MEIATLYINTQGSKITRVGERILVRNRSNKIIEDIPFFRVKQIICFGQIEISCPALTQLVRRGIDVVFLSITGRFKFRIDSFNPASARCRQFQYQKSTDSAFRLKIAREMLRGKLLNSKAWLVKRNRPARAEVSQAIWRIATAIEMINSVTTTDELLGIEGIAAKDYFDGFKQVLKQDMNFQNRNRRPPRDPVNAMLSFGYTILYNMVLSAVEQTGLDPFYSNLHAIQDRRFSLALDLMEEFRAPVIDTVVIRLVNLVRVQPKDFFNDERAGTKMKESIIALLVKEIQLRLQARLPDPVNGNKYKLKDLIQRQSWQYKSIIFEEKDTYKPVLAK